MVRRGRQSLSVQLFGEKGQLDGQASQKGEKLRIGEKSMLIFCLGCAHACTRSREYWQFYKTACTWVPLDQLCRAKPTVFLQHSSAKWCEQTHNCILFFQDGIAILYKSSFFHWRYEARVEAEEVCLSHLEHKWSSEMQVTHQFNILGPTLGSHDQTEI